MCSRNWRIAMMVPWLAFVAMLLDIWRAYDSLPAVIASHFNAAGIANGFAPKQPVFTTIIGVAFGLLCLFTFILSRFPQISGLGWLVMVAEFWGIGILFGITHGTLRVNLGEAKTLDFPLGIWSLIMGGALLIGEVGRIRVARKRAREYGELIAEETHASPVMGMIFLVIAIGLFAASLLLDLYGPSQTVPVIIGVVMLGCAMWAASGFRYRITTAGLEIRTLGLTLRFVPAQEIVTYRAESCNPLRDFGGWGIRGIGRMRAYIWGGNRCVHVQTLSGDQIYLGLAAADRMVAEMERMTPVAHR
jgi:hypothetical protein